MLNGKYGVKQMFYLKGWEMEGSERQISTLISEVRELKALVMQLMPQQSGKSVSAQETIAALNAQGRDLAEFLREQSKGKRRYGARAKKVAGQ